MASSKPVPKPSRTKPETDIPDAPNQALTSPDRRAWGGLWVLAASLAMIVLDGTIVGVALPTIIADLGLTLTSAQWVNSLYSVVFAALLITFGRLGDWLGRRRMLIAGVVIFAAGSALAASATAGGLLVASRAVQGVGGAMILPSTLSTVNATFRGRDRAAAFGIWGAVMSGAAAIGPLLGGLLTEKASWQWIFLVNLPISLAIVVLALVLVPETTSERSERGLDLGGTAISAIGFGALVFGLIEGNSLGWWTPKDPLSVGAWSWPSDWSVSAVPIALLIGLGAITGFIWRESVRGDRARLLDIGLFKIPTFAWGNLTAGLVAVGEFALVFVLPLYLVTALGLTTLSAGLVLSSMAGGAFVAGASARHLAASLGAPRVVVLGLSLEVIGAAATAVMVAAQLGGGWVAAALLPYGIGLGLASAQLTSTVLRDVPVVNSGSGSAVQSTVRQIGAALGSALAGTALTATLGGISLHAVSAEQFSKAAANAIWLAAGALVIGLAGSLQVARRANTPKQ